MACYCLCKHGTGVVTGCNTCRAVGAVQELKALLWTLHWIIPPWPNSVMTAMERLGNARCASEDICLSFQLLCSSIQNFRGIDDKCGSPDEVAEVGGGVGDWSGSAMTAGSPSNDKVSPVSKYSCLPAIIHQRLVEGRSQLSNPNRLEEFLQASLVSYT